MHKFLSKSNIKDFTIMVIGKRQKGIKRACEIALKLLEEWVAE